MNNDSSTTHDSASYEEQLAAWKADPKYAAYFKLLALPRVVLAPSANANRALATASVSGPAGDGEVSSDPFAGFRDIEKYLQVVVMGSTDKGNVVIYSQNYQRTHEKRIQDIDADCLLQMIGPPALTRITSDEDLPGAWTPKQVRKAFAALSGEGGVINKDSFTGVGCWAEVVKNKNTDSVVIVGPSHAALYSDGKLTEISVPRHGSMKLNFAFDESKEWFSFSKLEENLKLAKSLEWRTATIRELSTLLKEWNWSSASEPATAIGLILATLVQTLWDWRPQVVVLGKTKAGKSMLFKMLKGVFGNLAKTCSDSTEAGIRQLIRTSAGIVLFDEFDTEDKMQRQERRKIFKLLRSSSRGDSTYRGTANQKGEEFVMRHIVWLAGISIGTDSEADKNRCIMLNLNPAKEDRKNKLRLPSSSELQALGDKLLAIAIHCVKDARSLYVKIRECQIDNVDSRIIESYAVPAAMLSTAYGQNEEDAKRLISAMVSGAGDIEVHGDEYCLVSDMLDSMVRSGQQEYTVSHWLTCRYKEQPGWDNAATVLENHGIKLIEEKKFFNKLSGCEDRASFICIAKSMAKGLVRNTKWAEMDISQILGRIPGADGKDRQRFNGKTTHCVSIPFEYFKNEFFGEIEDQNL
jgi:hypothetical protein